MKKYFFYAFLGACTMFMNSCSNDSDETTVIATFEDVNLGTNTYDNGSTGKAEIRSSGVSLATDYNSTYGSWDGFALSGTTGKTFTGYSDDSQYNSCCGGGYKSKQFAVGYYSAYSAAPTITYVGGEFFPQSVYVTNTACAYLSMLNGDSYAKKFTDTDWFLLTITGKDADGTTTGIVEYYLAAQGVILNDWEKVDLTALGLCKSIEFTMTSSDTGMWGMNTPAYFCLDNLKIKTPAVFE